MIGKNGVAQPYSSEGFSKLLSAQSIFAMDLIGKNLQLNGIDVQLTFPDPIENSNEMPSLMVKNGQTEKALSILTSLDLLDFTSLNDK